MINLNALISEPRSKLYHKKKKVKELKTENLIKGKKCFEYNKINYFARDCKSKNKITRKESFVSTDQYLNAIIKEYFIEEWPIDG